MATPIFRDQQPFEISEIFKTGKSKMAISSRHYLRDKNQIPTETHMFSWSSMQSKRSWVNTLLKVAGGKHQ